MGRVVPNCGLPFALPGGDGVFILTDTSTSPLTVFNDEFQTDIEDSKDNILSHINQTHTTTLMPD